MVCTIRNIDFELKGPALLHGRELDACASAYCRRLGAIADYIYENIRDNFPGLDRVGLEEKLGPPLVDVQSRWVTYSRHSLVGGHIFSFQAADDFSILRYFTMDG